MNPAFNNPKLTRPALGCLRCFPSDDCPDDCRARNRDGHIKPENRRNCTEVQRSTPFAVWFVGTFLVFIVAPLVGVIVRDLKAERARERREIEAAARLKLLSEQQRLREAGAWLASAPPRKTEPTKPTGR